jgi:2'-hydroxyisoflavone reductase
MTRLLVLGGSGFVGRAVVAEGLACGWEVTTFNRGRRPPVDPRVRQISGDRGDPPSLAPLAERRWDLVLDTWAGPPAAVAASARLLADHAERYAYISSCSVYPWPLPLGVDETEATVAADPDATEGDYPCCKRGGELAAVAAFGDRALLARCGLILGPHEDVGRLPWWLMRLARGGDVLAPGLPNTPLQLIDARDLARFVLSVGLDGEGGPYNVASRRGHATMEALLTAAVHVAGPAARLVWVTPELVEEAGIEPWTELPIWIPPGHEYEGMHGWDVERAHDAGLRCRPVAETVADTWAWIQSLDDPPAVRAGLPAPGLAPEKERAALALAAGRA